MVGVVEPTVSLAPEAGEDFQAVVAAVQANPMAMLLGSGCSHHLMGTKAVFVNMVPSDSVKHVCGFNGALQPITGLGTVTLQGEAGKQVLIPDVAYVPGVQTNLLSAGKLKESGVQLQGDIDEMMLTEVVALRTIVSATKFTPDWWHARLAHIGVDTIKSSAKHEVATGLNIKPSTGADPPCVSCVRGELAWHTFPDKGSDAEEALAVVHIDLCGPFCVAAKNGSLYFLLLKDRHTRFVWAMPVAKMSDVLREFQQWLVLVERQTKKLVLMLRGGEFLGKEFTNFVNEKGIVHDLTCPYTPQQNGMAEREMRTVVESMRTMLLHMGVQHNWRYLALRQAVWVLDMTDNKVVTSVEVILYETLSLEVWKAKFGPASGRTQAHLPTITSMATVLLLAEVDEPTDEDVVEFLPPPPVRAPPFSGANWPALTPVSATGDEGTLETSPVAPASSIVGGQQGAKLVNQDENPSTTGEPVEQEAAAGVQSTAEQQTGRPTGELSKSAGREQRVEGSKQLVNNQGVDDEGELSAGEESTDSDVVEVPIKTPELQSLEPELRRPGRTRRPPKWLSYHACQPPAAFTTVYDDADDGPLYDDVEDDVGLSELDPDKGEAVKAAMDEEIRILIGMGTWELVERPHQMNIMKNRWVLTTKYRIDDTVEREKVRLVMKGFMQVYGADYDETYSPVSSYVTLRIFLSIVTVLNLNLMQLEMKNAFLQSKLDRVLYMYQPDYFDDGTGRVCKLIKSLYGLKQSPLLWYRALGGVLLGAGWKKSQVVTALYFKVGDDGVTCWALVYVDDLLAASSSTAMLKEQKELLEAAFEMREISPVVKYLGLEIVRDRPVRKLWLHQQSYADKLRRRFIDEEQGGRILKTSVSVDAYAELTFDDEEAQEREEEEYWQKAGLLRFAATTMRPDIAFACSKLGSGLTVRSNQYWHEVDQSLKLVGYVDADDVGDKQNRTSTGGYVFLDVGKPTVLRMDKSAITAAEGLGLMGNLKHMERCYAWLQHMVRRGKFVLKYIPTTEQPADFLMKALHFLTFNRCSIAIGQGRLAYIGDGDDDVQQ
ncbi:unnamed protein product [Closterium sp. NIES-53]